MSNQERIKNKIIRSFVLSASMIDQHSNTLESAFNQIWYQPKESRKNQVKSIRTG